MDDLSRRPFQLELAVQQRAYQRRIAHGADVPKRIRLLPCDCPRFSHAGCLVASDGGIFTFEAPFRGSLGGQRLNRPVSGMVPFGDGYLMVGEDGGIFNFSDRPFLGSLGANPPARPVVAVAGLQV